MRNVSYFSLIFLFMSTLLAAFDLNGGLGVIRTETGDTVMNLALKPDLKFKPWGLGLNINFFSPSDKKPADVDTVILRYAEYDDGVWGLRLGTLENVTYGYGLIINHYSTILQGSSMLTNQQMGLSFYTKAFPIGVSAFAARSNLYGVRFTEAFWPDLVFGKPLVLGETFVCDPDGVQTSTNVVVGRGQAGLGIDAGVPIIDEVWSVYTELASLPNAGDVGRALNGFSAGTKVRAWDWIHFNFQYLSYDAGFVPGYFNAQYETNPVNLASSANLNVSGKSGWIGTLDFALMDFFSFTGTYQSYSGFDPSLGAVIVGKLPNGISATLTYEQPRFASLSDLDSNNAAIKADLAYPIQPGQTMLVHYKRVAITQGKYDESTSFEYVMSFGSFF